MPLNDRAQGVERAFEKSPIMRRHHLFVMPFFLHSR